MIKNLRCLKNFPSSNVKTVVRNDICTGCGLCQGICPFKAISVIPQKGHFRPFIDESKCNNSKGCHRCYDVCPGIGINLIESANELFGKETSKEDKWIGKYLKCYTGFSNDDDLRYHAASGGLVTQFLIWLLECRLIDGAVVTKIDKDSPFKVKTFLATNKKELLSAKSSKYAPVTHNQSIQELKNASGTRYVVVGVPCQIEGYRKAIAVDKKLREKIVGLFSIYCSGTRTFHFTEYLMNKRKICLEKIDYLAYRDNGCLGGMVIKGDGINYYEDYQSYCHPLRSIFYPHRCILCVDHFGELSDISFGDIHVKPYSNDKVGVNSVIVRSSYWNSLLLKAKVDGVLTLDNLDADILLSSQIMAKVKKDRNITFCLIEKRMGKVVPDYGFNYGARIKLKKFLDYIQIRIQQFIGRHKKLWCLIPFLKAKVKVD